MYTIKINVMAHTKFSKSLMIERLEKQIEQMENEYGFDSKSGYSQVEHKNKEINRHYGEYTCLVDLKDEIESNYLYYVENQEA